MFWITRKKTQKEISYGIERDTPAFSGFGVGTLGSAVHLNEPGLEEMLPGSPQPPERWQCQPGGKPAHQLAFLEKATAPAAPSRGAWGHRAAGRPAPRGLHHVRLWFPQREKQIEIVAVWKTVLQKTIYPIVLNITISGTNLCWNEERGIHLINYEEQPDSMHSFLIVLGSSTACDDLLNAFATK